MDYSKFFKTYKKVNLISESTIDYLKHLIKKAIFEKDEQFFSNYKNVFYNKEFDLTDEQNEKGKKYLIKRYLTIHGYKRTDQRIVFSRETLNIISLLFNEKTKFEFKFCGFAAFSNGFLRLYEPIYKIYVKENQFSKEYSFKYVHFQGIDYDININCKGFLKHNSKFYLDEIL